MSDQVRSAAHPHRVLHVLTHLVYGGAEFYTLRLVSSLDPDRFVSFVCYLGSRSDLETEYARVGFEPTSISHRGVSTVLRTLWRLIKLIRRLDIQIVQTHGRNDRLYGHLAAWMTRTPVVDTLHSEYSANRYSADGARRNGRALSRLRLALEDWARRRSVKALIGVSEHVATTWKRVGSTFDRHSLPITVVPAPIDISRYSRTIVPATLEATVSALGLAHRSPLLITVSRLVHGKNLELLPNLVQDLSSDFPRIGLLIVGDGPQRASLATAIDSAGMNDRIRLLGHRDDVPLLLSCVDVFVFPSGSEAISLAVLEAVACGLPIVAFDLPPFRDFVVDGINGYKARLGDVDHFAVCARRVLDELETLRATASQQRQRLSRHLDTASIQAALDSVYSSARGYS